MGRCLKVHFDCRTIRMYREVRRTKSLEEKLRSKHEIAVLFRVSFHKGAQLPATTFHHKLSLTQVTSVQLLWLDGTLITSCHVASRSCCRGRGVEAHLKRHKELWVQLSKQHCSCLIPGDKVQPLQFWPHTDGLTEHCQHFNYFIYSCFSKSAEVSLLLWLKTQRGPSPDELGQTAAAGEMHACHLLPHLPDRTVQSSRAGSCSSRCVGRTVHRCHTRRSVHSLARSDSLCSLAHGTNGQFNATIHMQI